MKPADRGGWRDAGAEGAGGKLFYQVSLEEPVPDGHLLRRVAEAVDCGMARRLTARFYSHTGQPSVDPGVLFKMALLGYLYGLPSERRLVEEIQLTLAYRWFIGYDPDEAIPGHSVLSKARRRFGPTIYEAFFIDVVRQCDRVGLTCLIVHDRRAAHSNARFPDFGNSPSVKVDHSGTLSG